MQMAQEDLMGIIQIKGKPAAIMAQTDRQTDRQSSVELLKVFAIILIVISHVTQTLGKANTSVDFQDYVLLLGNATSDIQVIILTLLRQMGALGNTIFFICSAYFLIGRTKSKREKAFSLLSTVWVISVLYLCVYLFLCPSCLSIRVIIKQFLPTCFENNWYMTCYIIFLFIYPWLNRLIGVINQKQLLRITLFSATLWIMINYFTSWFFPSSLILWTSIYFLMAYLKLYCSKAMASTKVGTVLIVIGIIGYIAQVVVTNYVGLNLISYFSDKVLRWNKNCCPFYIMIGIGSLIIALHGKYKVRFINYISGLSMFIYLIHENYLFRGYTRPAIWQFLYENYGYSHVVLLDLAYSMILFLVTAIVSAIYKETIQRLVTKISHRLYLKIAKLYSKIEGAVLKIN